MGTQEITMAAGTAMKEFEQVSEGMVVEGMG
jgi:hypothetical protein